MKWTEETISRYFWRHVNKTEGCWTWTGELNSMGYGRVRWWENRKGHRILAHRFVLSHVRGEDIRGQVVLHLCDTPTCVNPDHLKAGTQSENIKDAVRKGRMDLRGLEKGRRYWPRRE